MDFWLLESNKGRRFNHAPSVAALEARFTAEDAANKIEEFANIKKELSCG